MKNNRLIQLVSLLFGVLFLTQSGVAQASYKQYFEKGLKAMAAQNFGAAMVYFSEAHDRDEENFDALYFYANAAHEQFAYAESEYAFQKIVEESDNSEYPNATYFLGSIKHQLGKYQDALHYYDLYLSENFGEDEILTERSLFAKKSCEWALNNLESKSANLVDALSDSINSPYSEHAAIWHEGKLEYSALKFQKRKDKHERLISKMIRDGKFIEEDNTKNIFNSDELLTSNSSYSSDGKLHFFTACDYQDNGSIKCEIYYRALQIDHKWGRANKLPQAINSIFNTNTQVNVGPKLDDYQTLFFVSDRIGGQGGLDIWSSQFDKQMNFQEPINLEINTAYDDITPYFDIDNNILYFSSNGRLGFGGFDIYKKENDEIQNIGAEVNSSFNEIYYTIGNEGSKAYFSSNRPGSQYLIEKFETCCYDIYQAEIDRCILNLYALTFDQDTRQPLSGVTLELKDMYGKLHQSFEMNANQEDFKIPCDRKYQIEISKDGYISKTLELNDLEDFHKELIYLERSPILLNVLVFDAKDKSQLLDTRLDLETSKTGDRIKDDQRNSNAYSISVKPGQEYRLTISKTGYSNSYKPIKIPNDGISDETLEIFLNKGKLELMVSTYERATKTGLTYVDLIITDKVGMVISNSNSGSNAAESFSLTPGQNYTIKAVKDSYEIESKFITLPAKNNGIIHEKIFLGRTAEIASLNNLIPLKLYFNNDSPDPNTMRITTQKHYEEVFFPYYFNKAKFKSIYSSKFNGERRITAVQEVETFFENDLKTGYDNLSIFMETLDRILQSGKKVNLYLRGYASPVAQSDYNHALGKRRVDCLRNEFEKYKSGKLLDYIQTDQLKITERSFGENQSSTAVSDDPNSPAASIFSPKASKERRIEIDEIKEIK